MLWPLPVYGLALAAGVLGLGLAARLRAARRFTFALVLPAAALAGLGATGLQAGARLSEALPTAFEGHELVLTGVVANLPQAGANGRRFRFEIEKATLGGQAVRVPPLVALGWYSGDHADAALAQPQDELRAGQRWRLEVRLRQPHGNVNPHGFDYALYLFEQGVRATGYVRDAPAPQRLDDAAAYPMESLRQSVRDASRTSSSEAFIDAAQPQIALVQAGYRNRYGHPVAEVLQRYRDRGIALRLSPSCGAWTRTAAGPAGGECERDSSRRYWHHTGALDPP